MYFYLFLYIYCWIFLSKKKNFYKDLSNSSYRIPNWKRKIDRKKENKIYTCHGQVHEEGTEFKAAHVLRFSISLICRWEIPARRANGNYTIEQTVYIHICTSYKIYKPRDNTRPLLTSSSLYSSIHAAFSIRINIYIQNIYLHIRREIYMRKTGVYYRNEYVYVSI